ncbi:MAG: signal peptide peptidase SppA [Planctomycetes bacterium]|nr:signal peptide peptidase SppA [Planctomycetota bacterium]
MKNFLLQILATLIAFAIVAVFSAFAAFLLFALLFASGAPPTTHARGAVLTLDLSEPIDDKGGVEDPFGLLGGRFSHLRLADVVDALHTAAYDDSIRGLFVHGAVNGSWAQARELRQALLAFKEGGKPIWAHFSDYEEAEFYLGSVADHSSIAPLGIFVLDGLAANVMYFADGLEKLGIEVQVSRVGKFKSAVEPFMTDTMSAENREQLDTLLSDLFQVFLSETAVARNVPVDALRDVVEHQAALTADEAVAAKFVDRVASFDRVLDELREFAGEGEWGTSFRQVALRGYVTELQQPFTTPTVGSGSNEIAVVFAQGEIVDGESLEEIGGATLARELRDLRTSSDAKAVVLRVDSPGGSAAASEEILVEVRRLRESGKTVVISMAGVAASGGYWISSQADAIVAQPNTITGSIGVFGMFPNAEGALAKLGLKSEVVKTGPHADWTSPWRRKSAEELALVQRHIDRIYDGFLERVSTGRALDRAVVEEHAQGRVWSGTRAKELGLVDELGGLDDAIALAAEKAGVGDDYFVTFPERRNPFDEFFDTLYADERGVPVGSSALDAWLPNELAEVAHTLALIRERFERGTHVLARLPFALDVR